MATLSPTTVEKNGGARVSVTGIILADGTNYNFHVGTTGTTADAIAYAGAHGTGNKATVKAGAGSFVTPILAAGTYTVLIRNVADSTQETVAGLVYAHKNHNSGVYLVRNQLPPILRAGPGRVEEEPPQGW